MNMRANSKPGQLLWVGRVRSIILALCTNRQVAWCDLLVKGQNSRAWHPLARAIHVEVCRRPGNIP